MYWNAICEDISKTTGRTFAITSKHSVGGGSINDAWCLDSGDRQFFAKINAEQRCEMFHAEAEGLLELRSADAIRVPQPICWGKTRGASYIVMEFIDEGTRGSQVLLGQQLAALHHHTGKQFGWHRDNTIGSTPQVNTPANDWLTFLRDQRLGFQLELAARNGYTGRMTKDGDILLDKLSHFFDGYQPEKNLLHGDLWSGNYRFDREGNPVIFDPAVYYGDREADIAMTELFGGFGAEFYAAYDEAYPLHVGYNIRKTLYNLYHILNHLNLFGSGYQGQAERMISSLLAEVR
ncbi:MAG: fructosamine kinase family protein [Gammaproteobacteria bacterium]|nr:fructosamine kinase family protein [Gammaproteobacteria bacterium]